jgi:hypothetical protein
MRLTSTGVREIPALFSIAQARETAFLYSALEIILSGL